MELLWIEMCIFCKTEAKIWALMQDIRKQSLTGYCEMNSNVAKLSPWSEEEALIAQYMKSPERETLC